MLDPERACRQLRKNCNQVTAKYNEHFWVVAAFAVRPRESMLPTLDPERA